MDAALEQQMLAALKVMLGQQGEKDAAVLATLLSFPGAPELEALQSVADPLSLYLAGCALREQLGCGLQPELRQRLAQLQPHLDQAWPAGQGERQLTGVIWSWLAAAGDQAVLDQALAAVTGPSMTMARSALRALQPLGVAQRELALQHFHDRWQERPVIFDSWFALEASTPRGWFGSDSGPAPASSLRSDGSECSAGRAGGIGRQSRCLSCSRWSRLSPDGRTDHCGGSAQCNHGITDGQGVQPLALLQPNPSGTGSRGPRLAGVGEVVDQYPRGGGHDDRLIAEFSPDALGVAPPGPSFPQKSRSRDRPGDGDFHSLS